MPVSKNLEIGLGLVKMSEFKAPFYSGYTILPAGRAGGVVYYSVLFFDQITSYQQFPMLRTLTCVH